MHFRADFLKTSGAHKNEKSVALEMSRDSMDASRGVYTLPVLVCRGNQLGNSPEGMFYVDILRLIRYGVIRYGVKRYGVVRHGVIWCMVRYRYWVIWCAVRGGSARELLVVEGSVRAGGAVS